MRIIGALLLLLGLLLAGLNTPAGFRAQEAAARMAGVTVTGLGGRFPDRLTASTVALGDWLQVTDAKLDWSPTALLHGAVVIGELTAADVTIRHWPSGDGSGGSSGGGPALPPITLDHLDIGRLALPEATLSVQGALTFGPQIRLRLDVASADVQGTGPARLHATLAGPRAAAVLAATLHADGIDTTAGGTLNLDHPAAQLQLTTGPIARSGVSADRITVTLDGTPDAAQAHATLTGLKLPGPNPTLLGPAPITLDAQYGPSVSLDLHAATAQLSLHAPLPGATIAADWKLTLPDLAALDPDVPGSATLTGTVTGPRADLTATTTIDARLATGPVTGTLTLRGLPTAPVAAASLQGSYNGTEITLDAGMARDAAGVIHVAVPTARALGLVAQAVLAFDPQIGWPTCTVQLQSDRLPVTGGTLDASLDLTAPATATLTADAKGMAVSGVSIAAARLAGTVTDALATPRLKLQLDTDAVRTGAITEALTLAADGPANALALRLAATGTIPLQAAATLDAPAKRLTLSTLQASAAGQSLRLAAQARLDMADGIRVDRLRLALGAASLDVAGRLSPTLDLTAFLRGLDLSLAKLFAPTLDLHGTVQADATLRGSPSRPSGSLHLTASGVRSASAAFVPPASLRASATLTGTAARIDATADAGPTHLSLTGTAPLAGGSTDLHATGRASLALLDPLLAAAGQQARGLLTLDASLTGPGPSLAGRMTLTGGSFLDATAGLRITDIAAQAHADDGAFVLDSLTARAGGPITASGRLDRATPQTVTATLTARDITPVTSDELTARLSADLTASGALATGVTIGGTIRIARADIQIPDRRPSSLPSLAFRQVTPPPTPAPPIALDLTVQAPGQIFLRGRGINAELAGRLRITGTAAAPQPQGGFTLQRGQVALAGQTLNFTAGRVSLDGHLPIDPTLDFTATAQGSSVIATLEITGTASQPRISLSSTPSLPQDEVLAQLLFHQSAASLGPLQIAQIATGLAQLTDIGGAGAFDPLGRVRQGLGLDTLSVGGAPGGPTVVEGGRSIARGVTLGARQSVGGVGTQATVRVDLARGLRLEANVGVAPPVPTTVTQGAAPTGNQVGITYEFQY
jgi:translocation and assembly module TamB